MNRRLSKLTLYASIVALASSSLPLLAQATSGNLTGNVYDPSGAVIADAAVIATNEATGAESSTHSTSAGDYRFENLPIGNYSIAVSAPGFAKAKVNDVNVQLNQTVTANVNLSVSQASTTVEVSEASAVIDTTTAQLQTTFEAKQLADLPTTAGGSGVLNLSLLNAGVATSGAVGVGTGPSVAGQRPRNNNFTVEGIDNNAGNVTGPLVTVPNDAVAEFSTLQNQYSPDFGHSSGGQFNLVVKSGSNAFHGMLYEYLDNRDLRAADPLSAIEAAPLHPRFDNNRFGGNIGGPIQKNKLFFFVNYEYDPFGQSSSAGTLYAPTQAGYTTIANTPGVNQTNLNILKKYLGTASTPVPTSLFGSYPVLGTLAQGPEYVPGNFTGINPGTPIEVGQISVQAPSYTNFENAVAAIDYNPSNKDAFRGRFILNRDGTIDTGGGLPVFFQTEPVNSYLLAISEYHNFSPSVVNELRLGYNRFASTTPATTLPFPGLDQFPIIKIFELNTQLGGDQSAPNFIYQNTYQLTNNITWTKGAHSFKFGFDGIRNISPQSFTQRLRGDYEYNYLNDYLFDFTPDVIAQRSAGNPVYWGNRWLFGLYANDSWRIRQNLTVNLGVRYEYDTPPATESEQTLNALASVPGLIGFTAPKAQTDNIMPRIGLAYTPGTSGKTSIRAGFGINYDVLFDNLGLSSLPPQLSVTNDVTGNGGSNFLANGGLLLTSGGTLSASQARARTSGYVDPNVMRPKAYQWNFGVEHEFRGNYIFETRYVGTRGTDLDTQIQLNRQSRVTAANALPVFWSQPSAAQIAGLTNTLSAITATSSIVPAYAAAGFASTITTFLPDGNSSYHGWANQLTRRFSNGLQFIGAYTWSHTIDNSTADVNSTSSTPRRAQDSQDLVPEKASSALDHRNRITISAVYDLPYFKHSNWFMKNLVGNWELAPIYTYQTGTLFTVQSSIDSNLNGDSASDRAIVNPNGGNPYIGSGTSAIQNAGGDVVGYVVTNPLSKYVATPEGAIATAGRNTERLRPIDDIDLFLAKRFSFKERAKFEFSARFFNLFNHPQYTGGFLNDVAPLGATSAAQRNVFIPTSIIFNQPDQAFSGNPRSITLGAKIIF